MTHIPAIVETVTFVTDPKPLREARKAAAQAMLDYQSAQRDHRPTKRLHRAWVMAKAKAVAMEAQHG